MRITTLLLYPLLLSCSGIANGGTADRDGPPQELKQFIASGESVLAYEAADLNGDGLKDLVFIVEPMQPDDDDQTEGGGERTLKIAIRASNGALKVVKQSSRIVYCRSCGGSFGDPFAGLTAANKTFSVRNYGGSAWRWSSDYTFNYSKRDNTWQLVRVVQSSFHASEPDKSESTVFQPPRSFGKIDLSEFDPGHFKGVGAK